MNNGGFEQITQCNGFTSDKLKYWSSVDTTKFNTYAVFTKCLGNVPVFMNTEYQLPRTDSVFVGGSFHISGQTARAYLRNKLKSQLSINKTYCVKFYVNIRNASGYAIDSYGAYFGDNGLDTITHYDYPLTYLNPQIQNPTGNIITDTLNWILVRGQFTATGNEKYMVMGNFKSNAATNTLTINPNGLSGCDAFIDDVSCIDIDLPAYAGPDLYAMSGNTVYLGRQRDVGIDEDCMWYKLPNTTTAIDTAAGITVTVGAQTATYMVKQDICGNIKYDTVVVYTSAVGLAELKMKREDFQIWPNPADNYLLIKSNKNEKIKVQISDATGRLLHLHEVNMVDSEERLELDLQNGVYFVTLTNSQKESVVQKLIISK